MKTTPLLVLALFCCLPLPAVATLCPKCRDRSYQKDIGACAECGGMTTSGEYRLCLGCSSKLRECAHCRVALPGPAGGAQPAPIDTGRDGSYAAQGWRYEVRINNAGSRSQGVTGVLSYAGEAVAAPAKVNDYHVTPWGRLYWVGDPMMAWGAHGWMPTPLGRAPVGTELPTPAKPRPEAAE